MEHTFQVNIPKHWYKYLKKYGTWVNLLSYIPSVPATYIIHLKPRQKSQYIFNSPVHKKEKWTQEQIIREDVSLSGCPEVTQSRLGSSQRLLNVDQQAKVETLTEQ